MRLLQKAECRVHPLKDAWLGLRVLKNFTDNLTDRPVPLLPPLPGAEDPVLHRRWSSGPAEKGAGGGP